MNTLVVLRPVRHPASFTVNRKAQKIFVNREQFIVNPSDRNALEAALALAETQGDVTAVALGGEPALDALRMARAAGASRALRVAVPEDQALDALGISLVLRQVVAHIGGLDLILLGAEVLDSDTAQVGGRLAAELDWPLVEGVYAATALPDGDIGLVVSTAGAYRLQSANGPAVATVVRDCNKPRFAPAARIITVFSSPESVETLTLAGLGLEAAEIKPGTTVHGESFLPERTLGHIIERETAVRQLADAIRNR